MKKKKYVQATVLIVLLVAAYLVWTGGGLKIDYRQRDITGTHHSVGLNHEIKITAILVGIGHSILVPPIGYINWAAKPNLLVLEFEPNVPGNSVTRISRLDAVSGDNITDLLEFSRSPRIETDVILGAVIDLPKHLGNIEGFKVEASFGPSESDQTVFEIEIPATYSPKLTIRTNRSVEKDRYVDG